MSHVLPISATFYKNKNHVLKKVFRFATSGVMLYNILQMPNRQPMPFWAILGHLGPFDSFSIFLVLTASTN
jgi:hypothetical protein